MVVIAVADELDLATISQVRAYFRDKTAARPGHLALDLARVGFMRTATDGTSGTVRQLLSS